MPDLTAPPVTTTSMDGQQPARFQQGEQATFIITAPVDSEWEAIAAGGGTEAVIGVRLPGSRYLIIPAGHAGVRVIHGDITPTFEQMATDAIRIRDCPQAECTGWREQYERLADAAGLCLSLAAEP